MVYCFTHGSFNVPIEHHPTIRYMYMVYNGYYKVMSNIPKMGQLPTPVTLITCVLIINIQVPAKFWKCQTSTNQPWCQKCAAIWLQQKDRTRGLKPVWCVTVFLTEDFVIFCWITSTCWCGFSSKYACWRNNSATRHFQYGWLVGDSNPPKMRGSVN